MTNQAVAPVEVKATRTFTISLDDGQIFCHKIAIESKDEEEGDFSERAENGRFYCVAENSSTEGVLESLSRSFFKKVNQVGYLHEGRMYLSHRIKHIDISDEILRS
jgi:hypothetical protein